MVRENTTTRERDRTEGHLKEEGEYDNRFEIRNFKFERNSRNRGKQTFCISSSYSINVNFTYDQEELLVGIVGLIRN